MARSKRKASKLSTAAEPSGETCKLSCTFLLALGPLAYRKPVKQAYVSKLHHFV